MSQTYIGSLQEGRHASVVGSAFFSRGLAWPVHNLIVMAVFRHLLQRLGFVKLERYGLVLTPEGRVLSTHSKVLDDGSGGRIVGWRDDDPAMSELQPMERPSTTVTPSMASRVVVPPVAAPVQSVTPPVITDSSVSEQEPVMASAAVMPVAVAPGPVVDEDDWEWTIALARARAAAEDAEAAAAAGPPPRSPAVRTRPMPAVAMPAAMKDPASSSTEWPQTAPIGSIDYEDYSRVPTRPAVAIPRTAPEPPPPEMPRIAVPSTVIPVPVLPTMQNAARASRLEPVVRTIPAQAPPPAQTSPSAQSRFALGTGPVDSTTPSHGTAPFSDDAAHNLSVGDRTKPGVALPPAARAVQLPSVKRRMALRR